MLVVLEALKGGVVAIYPKLSRPACFFILSFVLSFATMSLKLENDAAAEKHGNAAPGYEPKGDGNFSSDPENLVVANSENMLHQDLKGRHMQMIAMRVQHSDPSSVY